MEAIAAYMKSQTTSQIYFPFPSNDLILRGDTTYFARKILLHTFELIILEGVDYPCESEANHIAFFLDF